MNVVKKLTSVVALGAGFLVLPGSVNAYPVSFHSPSNLMEGLWSVLAPESYGANFGYDLTPPTPPSDEIDVDSQALEIAPAYTKPVYSSWSWLPKKIDGTIITSGIRVPRPYSPPRAYCGSGRGCPMSYTAKFLFAPSIFSAQSEADLVSAYTKQEQNWINDFLDIFTNEAIYAETEFTTEGLVQPTAELVRKIISLNQVPAHVEWSKISDIEINDTDEQINMKLGVSYDESYKPEWILEWERNSVPLPNTLWLIAIGLAGVALRRRHLVVSPV